eukprot:12072436-Karenia_brevis.AAC.1
MWNSLHQWTELRMQAPQNNYVLQSALRTTSASIGSNHDSKSTCGTWHMIYLATTLRNHFFSASVLASFRFDP